MTRKYKSSWKSHRNSHRFEVSFDAPAIASQIEATCTICSGKIEESPMMRGVCYTCYQSLVASPETFATMKEKTEQSDPRIARRESILAAFEDEPLSPSEASELYTELAEIDASLQFDPSDTCDAFIGASWERMEEIEF